MLFNSYIFWAFFAAVILLYFRLRTVGRQNFMLLVASYVFYGCWDWRFLFLLAGTTVLDYFVGLRIDRAQTQRGRLGFLLVSVFANLGALGFFKYFDFFTLEMSSLLTMLGFSTSLPVLNVILPVGISFYTFQELSYTIDIYRKQIKPVHNILDFALYVSFFPQLVAGPIERSSRLIPQILSRRTHQTGDFAEGLHHVVVGMFKKVFIADNLSPLVSAVFSADPSSLTGPECLFGVYAFAMQIYCDFSGYSSIAKGIAKWMGFDLMTNFDTPYFARTPSEFWRRWHISLSTWLRDYLYIPLGGNKGAKWKTYRNLMLTMLIGGFWHGAGWTYIVWGAYQGLLLCAYRPFEKYFHNGKMSKLTSFLSGVLMFHLVCVGWLFFRAQSMDQVWIMLKQIATNHEFNYVAKYYLGMLTFLAGPLLLFEYWLYRKKDLLALMSKAWALRGLAYSYFAIMLWFFSPEAVHEFIYFQF